MKRKITETLIKNFEKYLLNEEKSAATSEKYIRDISAFFVWLGESRFIDKTTVIAYKNHLIQKYQPASVNSMLSSLNSFFTFCEWFEMKVKTIKIQRQIFASKNKELTKAEYEKLLKAAARRENKRLYYLLQTTRNEVNVSG